MDWNPSGENRIPLPDGVGLGKVALFPVIELLTRDPTECRGCPKCGRTVDQMKLRARYDAGHGVVVKVLDGVTEVTVPGNAVPIPESLRITGVAVFHKPASMVVRTQGTKKAQHRHDDPNDEYTHPRWTDEPFIVFDLPGGRERADRELAEHNAKLREDHARYSTHRSHADMEVIRG